MVEPLQTISSNAICVCCHTRAADTCLPRDVGGALAEWVMDKGYHSNEVVVAIESLGKRSYIAEPNRGRRRWRGDEDTKQAVYANRRRIKGQRGRRLMRRRGEMLERPFAHCLETGGMRRVFLRGRENIEKRYQVHVAGFNLGILMRSLIGKGTPRGLQGRAPFVSSLCTNIQRRLHDLIRLLVHQNRSFEKSIPQLAA